MNRFELHGLQKLFVKAVTGINDPSRLLFDADILREYVTGEVARIKHRLLQNVITIEGEDAARRYVRIHQYAVVAIMDKLFQRIDRPLGMECCLELDGLLSFLMQRFPQYFDDLAKAPLMHNNEVRMQIAMSMNSLEKRLVAASDFKIAPYIILEPLERFYCNPEEQTVSFWRLRHLRHIMEHAAKVVDDPKITGGLDDHLINVLFYLNYNSRKTFLQFTDFIHKLVPEELGPQDAASSLSYLLRLANRATVKPNTGYHPHAPTFKSQMIDYLREELASAQEECRPATITAEPEVTVWPSVRLDLSVAQLGCILKLVTDTGLVSADSVSGLIRSVSLHCVTKRSSKISVNSLRNSFYDIESGTQQAVQKILGQLLKSCEKISSPDSQDADG